MLGDVREQIANPCTGLAVLLERPRALKKISCLCELNTRFWDRKGLAVQTDQLGLVIKGVDMGWATMHEQENDPFHPWWKMWLR